MSDVALSVRVVAVLIWLPSAVCPGRLAVTSFRKHEMLHRRGSQRRFPPPNSDAVRRPSISIPPSRVPHRRTQVKLNSTWLKSYHGGRVLPSEKRACSPFETASLGAFIATLRVFPQANDIPDIHGFLSTVSLMQCPSISGGEMLSSGLNIKSLTLFAWNANGLRMKFGDFLQIISK